MLAISVWQKQPVKTQEGPAAPAPLVLPAPLGSLDRKVRLVPPEHEALQDQREQVSLSKHCSKIDITCANIIRSSLIRMLDCFDKVCTL